MKIKQAKIMFAEVFNIMTPDFPYTSENKTKCTVLYQKFRNL
jgi:hypothetical protein